MKTVRHLNRWLKMFMPPIRMVLIPEKSFLLFIIIFMVSTCDSPTSDSQPTGNEKLNAAEGSNDTLWVWCAQSQLNLAGRLKVTFQASHDGIPIEIKLYDRNTCDKMVSQEVNGIVLVSDANSTAILESYYPIKIKYARDGLVGIIHTSNPFCQEILKSGMEKQELAFLSSGGKYNDSKQAGRYEKYGAINVYTGSHDLLPCELWADFLGISPADLMVVTMSCFQDMIDSMSRVPLSMGLCCLSSAFDPLTRKEIEGIRVIPMDCNGNGMLEEKENFYENLDELQRAMWLGKYPCHAYIDHYILIKGFPESRRQIDFVKFVLTEGQNTVQKEGFISPATRIIQSEIQKLNALQATL